MPAAPARSTARKTAIHEESETIGKMQSGQAGELQFAQGTLEIGFLPRCRSSATSKNGRCRKNPNKTKYFWTHPPAAHARWWKHCGGADLALLVTEPTPFGLHDLKLVAQLAKREMGLPCGVVINKSGDQDIIIEDFCKSEDIPI